MPMQLWSGVAGGDTPLLAVIYAHAGAPSSGTSGTLAGIAGKGDLLSDTTNGNLYYNTGTLASPTWSQITIP